MIRQITVPTLTAAGTSTTTAPVSGQLLGVYLSNSGGTATVQTQATAYQLLQGTVGGTAWYWPRVQVCDIGGTVLTMDGTRKLMDTAYVCDYVQLAHVGSGTVSATLLVRQ